MGGLPLGVALLTWELGGGLGHCVNLAPIASSLIEQGHSVWFAARRITVAKKVFGDLPVKYLQAPSLMSTPTKSFDPPKSFAHYLNNNGFCDPEQLGPLLDAWRHLMEFVQPNVVVCEYSPTAQFAARWTSAARVLVGTGHFSPPDVAPWPNYRTLGEPQQLDFQMVGFEQVLLERANTFLQRDGLAPLTRIQDLYADVDANFLLTYPELDHYPNRQGAEYYGMPMPAGGERMRWRPGTRPKVFAYLKPAGAGFRLLSFIKLLREFDLQSIAYIPSSEPGIDQLSSENLRVIDRRVDLSVLQEECDLAILNGNAGASTALLRWGVPILSLPLYGEQAIFSRRIVELGAGLAADAGSVEQTAAQLSEMLHTDTFRQHAQAFATRYRDFDFESKQREICERVGELAGKQTKNDT